MCVHYVSLFACFVFKSLCWDCRWKLLRMLAKSSVFTLMKERKRHRMCSTFKMCHFCCTMHASLTPLDNFDVYSGFCLIQFQKVQNIQIFHIHLIRHALLLYKPIEHLTIFNSLKTRYPCLWYKNKSIRGVLN